MCTEARLDVILGRTSNAFLRQLSTWHRDKMAAGSLDDLKVSNDELSIERNRAKCTQSVIEVSNELDSNFCDLHGATLRNAVHPEENLSQVSEWAIIRANCTVPLRLSSVLETPAR